MGHSASIAKKYNSPQYSGSHGNDEDNLQDECESLATVSSYRPTSPIAHLDAQQFSFRGTPTSHGSRSHSRNSLQTNGTVPNGSLGYHRNPGTATSNKQLRSMRDVNHFLVKNPELLSRKQAKHISSKSDFADIEDAHKQIKTKQNVYLGFFDPPTIYGKGVDPEKQLKINQRVYLQLIHPTYNQQYFKPYRPLVPRDMIVVRKEDYTKKPPLERTRPPLKGMEVTRASPRPPLNGMEVTRASPESAMAPYQQTSRKLPHRDVHNSHHILPTSTPIPRALTTRKNDYVDIPNFKMKQQSSRGLSKLSADLMEVERRFDTPHSLTRSKYPPKDEDIVFDYSVDELGLRKKTKSSQQSHILKEAKGGVEPLYFRKSLAYNPKYSIRGNVLSDPL